MLDKWNSKQKRKKRKEEEEEKWNSNTVELIN